MVDGLERKVDGEGDLLEEFRRLTGLPTAVAGQITEKLQLIKEIKQMGREDFLKLMRIWERSNEQLPAGLAKQFFTFGEGGNRVVFCTNPLVIIEYRTDRYGHSCEDVTISYLGLCKDGFLVEDFSLGYVHDDFELRIINYVADPFVDDSTDWSDARLEARFWSGNLLVFHSKLRGQSPGKEINWETRLIDGTSLFTMWNLESVGDEKKPVLAKGQFMYDPRPVEVDEGIEMFGRIQARVEMECLKKLKEPSVQAQEAEGRRGRFLTAFAEELFGKRKKKKR